MGGQQTGQAVVAQRGRGDEVFPCGERDLCGDLIAVTEDRVGLQVLSAGEGEKPEHGHSVARLVPAVWHPGTLGYRALRISAGQVSVGQAAASAGIGGLPVTGMQEQLSTSSRVKIDCVQA